MASIRRWKNGWQTRWKERNEGKWKCRSITCKTKRAAEDLRKEVEHTVKVEGRYEVPGERESAPVREEPDLRGLIRAFLSGQKRAGRSKATILRYGATLDVFERWMRAEFPHQELKGAMLSESNATAFYDWTGEGKGRNGKKRSASTRRKYIEVILNFWSWLASRDRWREFVPARVPHLRHLDVAPVVRHRTIAPEWHEMDAAIVCAVGWLYALLVILRFTGLRVQQAMELRIEDVNLQRGQMYIRPELGKTKQEKVGRWVPISQHLVDIIRGWGLREGYLIQKTPKRNTGKAPSRIARSRDTRKAWDQAIEKYGVRLEAVRAPHHCFRAGFRSGLKRAGADNDAVEALIGHSLGLSDHYIDLDALPMREAVDLIPAIKPPPEKNQIRDEHGGPAGSLHVVHSR